jgi:cysteine desulfurase
MDKVYLDYAATTPLDSEVLTQMLPFFCDNYGNPSSVHYFGQIAEGAVENARESILRLLDAKGYELVFTSGGTESDNLALRGIVNSQNNDRNEFDLIISPVEHPAIDRTANSLEARENRKINKLRVDKYGMVEIDDLTSRLTPGVSLVSVIYANNEIGTINPVEKIAKECSKRGVLFHTDAVQAAAHLKISLTNSNISLFSIGAHKFYGPKGVGALIKKKGVDIIPHNSGGGQENGIRGGTHNVSGIVGFQRAFEKLDEKRDILFKKNMLLRDLIIENVLRTIPDTYLTGHPTERLPNHASFVFDGVKGNDLVIALDMAGFAVSSGSACKVGNPAPSEVLLAIGIPDNLALGALRITVGNKTSQEDVTRFLAVLPKTVSNLRKSK